MKPRVRRAWVPRATLLGPEVWWDIYMGAVPVASMRSWRDALFVANLIALNPERSTT